MHRGRCGLAGRLVDEIRRASMDYNVLRRRVPLSLALQITGWLRKVLSVHGSILAPIRDVRRRQDPPARVRIPLGDPDRGTPRTPLVHQLLKYAKENPEKALQHEANDNAPKHLPGATSVARMANLLPDGSTPGWARRRVLDLWSEIWWVEVGGSRYATTGAKPLG